MLPGVKNSATPTAISATGHHTRSSSRRLMLIRPRLVNRKNTPRTTRTIAAIVLVVLGVFFLLTNLGLISISLRELLRVWWPVALIAVGLALFFTPGDKKK